MAGQPGRSGGHNRIPIAEHLRRGTFRVGRHGKRPKPGELPGEDPTWSPGEDDLERLGPVGRKFVEDVVRAFAVQGLGARLVVEAAKTLDELSVWEQTAATDATAARVTLAYRARLQSLLGQLRVTPLGEADSVEGWLAAMRR